MRSGTFFGDVTGLWVLVVGDFRNVSFESRTMTQIHKLEHQISYDCVVFFSILHFLY